MKIMLGLILFFTFCFSAMAGGKYNSEETIVNNYYSYPTETVINNAINNVHRSEVRAAAAGQTNYKASTNLQWRIGSAFAGGESALSFGLGYQLGNIFITGSVTDNVDALFSSESEPLYTLDASGEF